MAYKPAQLESPDMLISEVMAFRRGSAAVVFRKIRAGRDRSCKSGDTRLIERASVIEARDRCLKAGPQLAPQTGKRGRPAYRLVHRADLEGPQRVKDDTRVAAASGMSPDDVMITLCSWRQQARRSAPTPSYRREQDSRFTEHVRTVGRSNVRPKCRPGTQRWTFALCP